MCFGKNFAYKENEKGKKHLLICKYSVYKKQVSIVHHFWVGSDIYD